MIKTRLVKKSGLLASFLFCSLTAFSQINLVDSTVQVISYWNKSEKHTYSVSTEKIKIKNSDTTSREAINYDVEITVHDSVAKTYTIEWLYKNFSSSSPNPSVQKLIGINKDMKVIFKVDEMGAFIEVINWQEIKDFIQKAMKSLSKDFKDIPEMDKVISQLETIYSTKEAIESSAIKDILQFHFFHGGKYKKGEVLTGKIKVPNIFSDAPLDSEVEVYLDEINAKDADFVMRSSQEVDSEQLINVTFDYLKSVAQTMKTDPPLREDLTGLKHETLTASRIHESGWVTYSIQTTTVNSENLTTVEERIIELVK